jgi:hypothetical protein
VFNIAFGGGKFLATGYEGKMAYSLDGITWTKIPTGAGDGKTRFTSSLEIDAVIYAAGRFLAAGMNGTIVYSTPQE